MQNQPSTNIGFVYLITKKTKIDEDLVDLISSNLDAFHSFYELHRDEIIKYFIVFCLCPVNEENKSFLIFLRMKNNGAADSNIIPRVGRVGNSLPSYWT